MHSTAKTSSKTPTKTWETVSSKLASKSPAKTSSAKASEKALSTKELETELFELERRYWSAIKNGDAETVARLSNDPCIVAGAQGVGRLDRTALVTMFKGATWKLESFEISDPIVISLSDDVAAIAYKVSERLTINGDEIALEASDASTWVRRDGQWLCAVHTEAPAGDPFGRDHA